ncbi:tetratricopeptide repeat protein [Clostridium sp.]|jgi:tetratricopeptide (TPR) repeat protein|uniref:tetratricopeptide repeat protein n=1 Tax=Clostridium sp. TaxID=1506 RepID=UPI003EEAD9F8
MLNSIIIEELKFGWDCYTMGTKFTELNDLTEAIRYYEMASVIVSKYRDPYKPYSTEVSMSGVDLEKMDLLYINTCCSIGQVFITLNKYQESLVWYEKLGDLGSYREDVINSKAMLLSKLGRNDDALKCYDESIQVKEDPYLHPILLFNKSLILYNMKQYSHVIPCINIAIDGAEHAEDNDTLSWAYLIKANTLQINKNTDEALIFFKKAAHLGNTNAIKFLHNL